MNDLTAVQAALYGGLGGGLIGGVFALLGVVVERLLRSTGRLRCETSGWDPKVFGRVSDGEGGFVMKEPERPEDAGRANYRLSVDLFNGREVPTGLLNPRVELFSSDGAPGGEPFVSIPQDLSTTRRGEYHPGVPGRVGADIDDLKAINLPPRQIVHIELKGTFGKEAAVALAAEEWSRVEFVGELPAKPFFGILGSKTYRKTITEQRGPGPAGSGERKLEKEELG